MAGPVEIKIIKGRGRGIYTKSEVSAGDMLIASEPLGGRAGVLTAGVADLPDPTALAQHLAGLLPQLSSADAAKLRLLYDGSPESLQRRVNLKDLMTVGSAAASRAAKGVQGPKGFGAPPQQQGDGGVAGRLEDIVRFNAWGSETLDLGAAALRGEQQGSVIGLWPEPALMNHSCAPNTCTALVGSTLVVRAARSLDAGEEATSSYLGPAAAAQPLQQRQELLRAAYGFTCRCQRCTTEAAAPQAVQQQLARMHEWAQQQRVLEAADAAVAAGDRAGLEEVGAQATRLVGELEAALAAPGAGLRQGQAAALRASGYGCYAAAALAALARHGGSRPADVLPLVQMAQVLAPGSDEHIALAADFVEASTTANGRGSQASQDAILVLLMAYVSRYGRVSNDVFAQLAAAHAAVPSRLGRLDIRALATQRQQQQQQPHPPQELQQATQQATWAAAPQAHPGVVAAPSSLGKATMDQLATLAASTAGSAKSGSAL